MDNKILLQDLSQGISNRTSVSKKETDSFLRTVFDVIFQGLIEDKIVKVKGLGTFKVIEVSGRDSVNINNGERIHISGHSKISFTPDTSLRDQVNRPFADFETIIINDGIDVAVMESIPDEGQNDTIASYNEEDAIPVEVVNNQADEQIVPVDESEPETIEKSESVEEHVPLPVDETHAEVVKPYPVETSDSVKGESVGPEPVEEKDEHIEETLASIHETTNEAPTGEYIPEGSIPDEYSHVYADNKPCVFCRICFILLTLCLMALSYLAGVQHWFSSESEFPFIEKKTVESVTPKPVEEKTVPTDTLRSDTVTHSSALTSVSAQNDTIQNGMTSSTASNATMTTGTSSSTTTKTTGTSSSMTTANYPNGRYEITGTHCIHVVKSGEGLYRLARIYYGNMNMATYIIKYNNITNPDLITEGMSIKIPELNKLQ